MIKPINSDCIKPNYSLATMTDPITNATSSSTTTIIYASDLQGIKPPSFNWDAVDLPQQFRSFKRYCELVLSTPTYSNKSGKEIVNYILLWMGPQAVEIFDSWSNLSDTQKETPKAVWEAFFKSLSEFMGDEEGLLLVISQLICTRPKSLQVWKPKITGPVESAI